MSCKGKCFFLHEQEKGTFYAKILKKSKLNCTFARHEARATHYSCYRSAAYYAPHNGSSRIVLPSDTELGST